MYKGSRLKQTTFFRHAGTQCMAVSTNCCRTRTISTETGSGRTNTTASSRSNYEPGPRRFPLILRSPVQTWLHGCWREPAARTKSDLMVKRDTTAYSTPYTIDNHTDMIIVCVPTKYYLCTCTVTVMLKKQGNHGNPG